MTSSRQHAHKSLQPLPNTATMEGKAFVILKRVAPKLAAAFVMALFFVFVGTDSITDIIVRANFKTDLVVAVCISFLLLSYVQGASFRLNQKYSWRRQFRRRMVQQLLQGVIVPALGLAVAVTVYFFAVMQYKWTEVGFFYNEFPMCVVVIAAINIFYAAWFFSEEAKLQEREMHQLHQQVFTLQQALPAPASLTDEPASLNGSGRGEDGANITGTQKVKTLVAVSGNKNIPIATEQIAYIMKEGSLTKLLTFGSEFYLLSHTLDELMKLLDESQFFRANRQVIINLKACRYFTNEENGKLALSLTPETEEEVIISQKRSAIFKEWLNGNRIG